MATAARSVFLPAGLRARAAANAFRHEWAGGVQQMIVDAARPWLDAEDEELWGLVFGPALPRSWMVWSDGYCPACRESVPMYTWRAEPWTRPWKMTCPHCEEAFPKNDFGAFHRSGLNEQGVFDPERADRALLFNAEHPDPADALHRWGVDDGTGWVADGHTWRFIGAYLVYGLWKAAIHDGILRLADAYAVTGDVACARKAIVLLDRVADVYPGFDFATQGFTYEEQGNAGYVSVWHDACEETRQMALAWDCVRDASDDAALVAFLSARARETGNANPKAAGADIRRNIEDRILRDALATQAKIHSNFPRTESACLIIDTVLGWPGNRAEIVGRLDEIIEASTQVDGVTGEKGMANYSSFTIQSLALLLQRFDRFEPGFVADMVRRHPQLHQTWRFHIDTWCMQRFYPSCGDARWFAAEVDQYQGVRLHRPGHKDEYSHVDPTLAPSMFTFLWRLHEATGDAAFVQALYRGNDDAVDGIPWDVFAPDADDIRQGVQDVIAAAGARIRLGSVDKSEWHLAILRSGADEHERAVWLDYDSGALHAHMDGMNLGMFALGLDLMPDFGYPPVQFGGWTSPKARWYMSTAAHNTVVVDRANQNGRQFGGTVVAGRVTLWAEGDLVQAVRASGAALYDQTEQYERTVFVVDVPGGAFYALDVFRVVGGSDHAAFTGSHFGAVSTEGLTTAPADDYDEASQMRDFRCDASPAPGWSVDWAIDDRQGGRADVHFRLTGLTTGASVSTCEAWVVPGHYNSVGEEWVPRVMVRRQGSAPLASTFVSVLEPYEGGRSLAAIRRLPLVDEDGRAWPDSAVAVEVVHADGTRDLIVTADVENPRGDAPSVAAGDAMIQPDWGVRIEGEGAFVRRGPDGETLSHMTIADDALVAAPPQQQ